MALLAWLLAVLASDYFFLPPIFAMNIAPPEDRLTLFVFLAVAWTGYVVHLSRISRQQKRYSTSSRSF